MTISDAVVTEGDSGQRNAVFTVSLDMPTNPATTVEYQTFDETASATDGDYVPVSGVLSLLNTTQATISVPVLGDRKVEPDELFIVELSNVSAGVLQDPIGEGTILNDDVTRLSVADTELVEGDQGVVFAVFTASLDVPSSEPVTARFSTGDITATVSDGDYLATSGMLLIPAGALSTTFSVAVNGDLRAEPDETFDVILGTPVNAVLAGNRGIATIFDDDRAGPAIFIGDVEVVEGDEGTTTAVFPVTLSESFDGTVTVAFATADGTATTADGDYLPAAGTVTFQAGSTAENISVEVAGDVRVEPDETFSVQLSKPSGAILEDGEGTATVLDDDDPSALPTISISDVEVPEGDAGTVEVRFQLTLSDPTAASNPVSVRFATADGTGRAADGDYQPVSGEVAFPAGATTTTVVVRVNGDLRPELDELFFVDLSQPNNATIDDGRGQGTILNDDQAGISVGDTAVVEGDAGITRAVFRVSLTAPSPVPVTVNFATVDGTATVADGDYQPMTGQVGFAAGQTTGTIAVNVNGDIRQEGDEAFFVDLSNPTNAVLADGRGEGTVRNDDVRPGTVSLRTVSPVTEGDGTARIEVELARAGVGSGSATVRLTASAGSATAGEDFTPFSRTLTWGPGERGVRVVQLAITDDRIVEGDETVVLRLSQPTGVTLGTPATAQLVIVDDDTSLELQAVGELSRDVTVREALDLVVLVTGGGGEPVAGAEVQWSVDGDAMIPNGSTSTSDEDGLARQRVQLGTSAGQVTVTARAGQGEAQVVVFQIRARGNLASLFGENDPPGGSSVAEALDEACVEADGELSSLCNYLLGLDDPAQQKRALEELLPREVAAQVTTMLDAAHTQLDNLRARQAELRRQRGGSRSGPGTGPGNLTMQLRGEPVRLASLTGSGWNGGGKGTGGGFGQPYGKRLTFEDMQRGQDPADEQAKGGDGEEARPSETQEIGTDFSRWGLFVNGSLSVGDRPTSGLEAGFDFDTTGLTVGVDYRLSDRLFFGGAVGWLDTRADVVADGGRLDIEGYSLLAYGSYYWQGFYVDVAAGFGTNETSGARNIDLAAPLAGQSRFVASSTTDGRQLSGSVRVGYDRQMGATTLQGFADLSVVDLTIDGYRERGGGAFDLTIGEQDATSLLAQGGIEAARAISLSWGVLRPMVRGAFLHELADDSRQISARFTADRSAFEFVLPTETPDRNYFNLAAGVTATLVRGRTLYLVYDRDVGREDLDTETLAVGFRLEF